ncbi:MAG: NADH-quinone oxidoreductase subunit NuoN [Actinomyces sp.]|nr:NADH-quinone oxidoreductase subunit NuoN [Actinomyces sp.]MCI1662057.1 NADH-quinone oxidoreductase subunit NuoN [Actinomyces sp.]MCI1787242.1 NADH-quinone oxidoreductase subunit NuoN [Actinomyces sp.]MCI1829636.1 NADH-quinone oxidoreductase subunit NuoN [Actinomyces sp.]MCI1866991.1 NADH-quinone oxidoreductase subunit NuoN [Actinomyces sp.]
MNLFSTADFATPTIGWASLSPVLIVLGAAVAGVLVESFAPQRLRRPIGIGVALLATLGAAIAAAVRWVQAEPSTLGEYVEDPLTLAAQFILAVVGVVAILVMADRTQVGDGAFAGQPSDRPGSGDEERTLSKGYQRSEMFPLTLFSLGGMMVFPAADSFVTLFVALEVMSLPLYILAATARRRRQLSQEAGLKYFLLGAFASAFLLMGSALLYGYSGSLTISEVATALPTTNGMDWLVVAGSLLVMVGLLFKVAAVPFHAWTPDVYTGAPTPVTGFMAAAVKVAAFAAMLRFYQVVAGNLSWNLLPILAVIAGLTIVVGTFAGVVQDDVKRMLAYSSIAHAGFILIGILSLQKGSAGSVLFYALGYAVATVGAFGVVTLVRSADAEGTTGGEVTALDRWAGLGKRSPWVAGSMLVFLLSFAGIPLTAGFVGKFVIFSDGFAGGLGWLVGIALACSVVTAFFYFRLVRLMFFTEPTGRTVVVTSEGLSAVAIAVCAVGTIVLGVFPNPVLSLLNQVVILLP